MNVRNYASLLACLLIGALLVQHRMVYPGDDKPLKVTEWDAFGYYIYLPAFFIYHDYKELKWLPEIDKKYAVTGGNGWQAIRQDNGVYTFKYLGGIAILESPFFFLGHLLAPAAGYPQDGFSPPYQYALGFGVIFYCLLAIFLLRRMMLLFFDDQTTALSLLLLCLATNFIQYAAVDNGQSHGYLFVLYALVLWGTLQWHRQPRLGWAALTGLIIGLATMSRPTEAIMIFIPIMWNTQSANCSAEKWKLVRTHKTHLWAAALFGLLGILPQLLYWKLSTGSFVFDVGSKWDFLNPHFRVLFGWEKGWFIYTPVTLLFLTGMSFMRTRPFQRSVLWFCLLNIYIIIAWHEWRYGGSYSTRALVQSYPVFALPLACLVARVREKKWHIFLYILETWFILVNLFQVYQYNKTILHYDDMNRRYYSHIFLNPNPTPLDMSLLDSNDYLSSEKGYIPALLFETHGSRKVDFDGQGSAILLDSTLHQPAGKDCWIKIMAMIRADNCLWQSYLCATLTDGTVSKNARVRLFSPISKNGQDNIYAFYVKSPARSTSPQLNICLKSAFNFHGWVKVLRVTSLAR